MKTNFSKKAFKKLSDIFVYPKAEYPIFLNSLPKSGTHLLSEALTGLPGVSHSGKHFERKAIAKYVDKGVDYPVAGREDIDIIKDLKWIERLLHTIKPGRFITSHMFFHTSIINTLNRMNFRILQMIRDPRDVVLSWANYIIKEKDQPSETILPFY